MTGGLAPTAVPVYCGDGGGSERGSVEHCWHSGNSVTGLSCAIGGLGTGVTGPDSGDASWGLQYQQSVLDDGRWVSGSFTPRAV
jgi:hypothetical protein